MSPATIVEDMNKMLPMQDCMPFCLLCNETVQSRGREERGSEGSVSDLQLYCLPACIRCRLFEKPGRGREDETWLLE